jgi:putative hydrolase of the HAD superfamily
LIKAVFFDWFNTLAVYYPPREELQSKAIQEFGFTVSPDKVRPALMKADQIIYEENSVSPMRLKSPEEQAEIYNRYEEKLLSEVGIDTSEHPGLASRVIKRARELYRGISFKLFDDVQPVLENCKERSLLTGLITNLEEDLKSICSELGIEPYIDVIVTSGEAGSDKPQPEIFLLALEKAGVKPDEAIHVGDQYKTDALGAAGVGIKPVIIDRYDQYTEITDYPRIRALDELFAYL